MRASLAIPLLFAFTSASAAPVDVSLPSMTDLGGVPIIDPAASSAAYSQVIRELGQLIGSPSLAPPTTTGATGLEVALEGAGLATDLYGRSKRYTTDPSPWDRVIESEKAPPIQWTPGISIRKGLPFSLELAMRGRWLANTRQGTVGGEIRGAVLEGHKGWPDLGLHMGYDGYIGNPTLRMGVMSLGMGFGGTFKPGVPGRAHNAIIRPYLDVSLLMVHASPLLDDKTASQLGVMAYGAKSPNPEVIGTVKAMLLPRFSAGLQFDVEHFLLRLSGGYTLQSSPQFAFAIGFRG